MLVIRNSTESDVPALALLARVTFSETFGHLFRDRQDLLDYLDQTFSVDKLKSSLQKPNNRFWMAFYEDLSVGYAKVKFNSTSPFLEMQKKLCQLQKIYVLQDFLPKKIGVQLWSSLLGDVRSEGFGTMWLSVYDDNVRAIRFYEKQDFVYIGKHRFQIGKEDFGFQAMAKRL
ncbi:MAG: GNAT family N-acetyltransferase [Bacteroidota bacterium]